jgi:hypothetical protein
MSPLRRCQECDRRITDVIFCRRCGHWFCCTACLALDNARHARSSALQVDKLAPPVVNAAPMTTRELMLKLNSRG